ncbi:MAG: type II toxin-antitoxin system Phd/YefM family antitoxin [Gemmataceae bacterium]|nr:type II toxin-antitoxin system Phd/YefM family antitoxin [Gemmataceae bacterium]
MKTASVAELKARLSAYIKESEAGPVVITRKGRPVALLLTVEDEDEMERLILAHSPRFRAILERAHREIEEHGGIPHDQFWEEVERERQKPPKKPPRKSASRAEKAK